MRPAQLNREKIIYLINIFPLVSRANKRDVSISVKRTEMSFSGLPTDFDSHDIVRMTHAFGFKRAKTSCLL